MDDLDGLPTLRETKSSFGSRLLDSVSNAIRWENA
jgi:hypothetical protein